MTDYHEVTTSQHEPGQEGRLATFKVTQLIWLFLGILEALLALRFFFKLVGVNAGNGFSAFLYGLTGFFVAPFASLTSAPAADNMVFEFTTLIAIIVYALVGWGLERLVQVLFYRPRGRVSVKQTSVSEHMPLQTPATVSKTTVTEHTNNQPSDLQ